MATNRDVLNQGGLEKLLLLIDSGVEDNYDSTMAVGCRKYGCIIDTITQQPSYECYNFGDSCKECICHWLDEEYDGTWEIDPD